MSDSHRSDSSWTPEMEQQADQLVEFLKDPSAKQSLKEFLFKTYKEMESRKVEEIKARVSQEVSPQEGGNIAPLVHDALNMHETERSFARGLKSTKHSMVRSLDHRVEEINRLLAGVGGFCAQLKSCFARSTVVFLEQEDPKRSFRERLTFSINLPNYELKVPWEGAAATAEHSPDPEDGRSAIQATWDRAVNELAHIIEETGLKPKYCKNDRHFGRFVMKQDLRHSANLPDEYFSFTLDYNTEEKIQDMMGPYHRIVAGYEQKLAKLSKRLDGYDADSMSARFLAIKKKYLALVQERDYFMATTPDPSQIAPGLLFLIEVSTLKDYQIVKDRMQSIMTKYILHLSRIATAEAKKDPAMEFEMWRAGKRENDKTRAAQVSETFAADAEDVPEYEVEEGSLKPVPRTDKKAA